MMVYLFEFYAVEALFFILNLIPLPLSGWVITRVGDLYYYVSSKRRNIAFANLTIAYGDTLSADRKRRIARKCFESSALSILELFLIKKIKKNAPGRFTTTGKQYYEEALSRGKGVIFVASHLGAWEYIAFAGHLSQVPHGVIVKKIKNTYLDKMIDRLRREIDTVPIP